MNHPAAEQPVRVLIVESSPEMRSSLARLVDNNRQLSLVAAVAHMSQALELAAARLPDVILLDGALGDGEAVENARLLAQAAPQSDTILLIAEGDTESLRRAAGAPVRTFLLKPLADETVLQTIREVHEAQVKRLASVGVVIPPSNNGHQHGRVVSVFSPKGGAGCSTIAANLAIALQQALARKRVAIVDGSLQSADVGVLLNLTPRYTMSDLIPRIGDLDARLVEEVLTSHRSGVRALLAPADLNDVIDVSAVHVRTILSVLQELYGCVLVDAGHSYDEVTLAILDASDRILIVTTPEMTALRNVKRFFALSKQLSYPAEKLVLVLNRFPSTGGIKLNDIEEHLKLGVAASIPSDGRLVTAAANEGLPLMLHEGGSRVGNSIAQLAKALVQSLQLLNEPAPPAGGVEVRAAVAANGGGRSLWPFKRA